MAFRVFILENTNVTPDEKMLAGGAETQLCD